jgi:hypothetical protein
MHPAIHHTARQGAEEPNAERDAIGDLADLSFHGPVRYDRPFQPDNTVFLSPVQNLRLANDQEMQSGADETSGVFASKLSGGDYSREQGVGRAPGWRWPWNEHSLAFNFASLDRWAIERTGLGLTDPHSGINPEVGVAEPPYSPITAMDQLTTFYENDPDQHAYWPTPVVNNSPGSVSYAEVAVLEE